MGWFTRMVAAARPRLGRAFHDAGGATRADVRALGSDLEGLRHALGATAGAVGRLHEAGARLDALSARVDALEGAQSDLREVLAIDAFTRFIGYARLRAEPLVSVVLPTYNRPEVLRRAIASVTAQRYRNWELVVVDDGGDNDSKSVVDDAGDSRIRWMRVAHGGVCAARNAALAVAGGEIIAYLDDDNVMDADWLYSVAWALEQRPDVEVLYGAFVIDDLLRVRGESSGHLPRTFLQSWNREALRSDNLTDMGAIAHRSDLPEARFDESLRQMGDWDLLLRLTADRDPLVLPAIACYYMTDVPNRLTLGPTHDEDDAAVRARAGVDSR